MRRFIKLVRDTRGATAIEYALIASLISVAAVAAFVNMGSSITGQYNNVNDEL